ncbi:RluA family pseudouridine synthase [Patescibacteria group bacterium]|nr:RluA family pseudouridine synthase [Patescibacteria group bacterium]MBU4481746.1 RluA family pseudouridine synthase [Patescibacteria group bacterium]
MEHFQTLYQDKDVLAIDKPAGVNADDFERRIHRLDKETSGILLIAKNDQALEFFQKQFKERKVEKRYFALVVGNLKYQKGTIETLIGRSPNDRRKQKVYLVGEPNSEGKREAVTEYKVLTRLRQGFGGQENYYTLIEVTPETGRKHQIRCHLVYLGHPVAGDKMYGFKNQPCPSDLKRQFLHAIYLKIKMPNEKIQEIRSPLPKDLQLVLDNLKMTN